jgi:hypothetical protein
VVGESDVEATAVCLDLEAARILVAAGLGVVLFGFPGQAGGRALADLRGAGNRRLAVFAGDQANGLDLAAAVAMATEQFGATPAVVGSADEARAVLRALRSAASPAAGSRRGPKPG